MHVIERFNSTDHYYSTLLHELVHWSGHKQRLDRFTKDKTENYHRDYGKEELVAEIGSAILCHKFGITLPEHNASYLDNWIKVIKGNRSLLFGACSKAEKIIEYLKVE